VDVGAVLLDILIVLVAAKAAAEVAERVGVPGVVAEILAGVAIGPSVLGFVSTNETLRVLGELGVILLLLQVGMEMNLRELGAVGRASLSVAVIGVVVPMATGFAVAEAFSYDDNTALFLAAALSATSVGITARVFSDLRALASVEARTVLGAAVADDVLGLVILTVVVRVVSEGTISIGTLAGILVLAIGFLIVATAVGAFTAPRLFQWLQKNARSAGTLVALVLAFTLAFAEIAEAAKLAPIVGAFVAGLALSRSSTKERINRELAPVGHLFIPVFFLEIGIDAQVEKFVSPEVLGIAAALFVCAVVGKLVSALGAVGSPGDRWLIGFGMIPRGEVGLIFATIGLKEGILGGNLYAALLLVVLATTLVAPPLLRWRLLRIRSRPATEHPSASMPPGGWLRFEDGAIELAAQPPSALALQVGFDAALAVGEQARPGPDLLDWLVRLDDAALRWDDAATERLLAILVDGTPRSWRFLETTGLLERALPELAEAVRRRRADPSLLEPAHVLRFAFVERVRESEARDPVARTHAALLEHPGWLLLAALILDAAGEDAEPVALARRLASRLDLGAAAEQEIALLVGDAGLMRAAAARLDGLEEERVTQIATHLERPERGRALYLLTLALGDLEPWDRERLDELLVLVLAVLERPDLTGLDARNLVERRRNEALRLAGHAPAVAERIKHAPRPYLLSQDAADVARQARLLEPLPSRGRARVAVQPVGEGEWQVEVVSRDRPGLLARVSGELVRHDLDVVDATIATWDDGGALDAFRVRSPYPPDAEILREAIESSFEWPITSEPEPNAVVEFDDAGSPWYTLCEVRVHDHPGFLHAVTTGFAAGGANVHSARVTTVDGVAVDTFELTDRNGRKLDEDAKRAITSAIHEGVTSRRKLLGRRSR
jgi:Kef-type K+ transport system membrane component KefB